MPARLSKRLQAIVDALPLEDGTRVLEIGCGPGAMARDMARRVGSGHVLAIDRSAKAVARAVAASADEIRAGRLSVRHVAVETFALDPGETRFDLAVAVRVGALDGRHPAIEQAAMRRIAHALTPGGVLYIDGGTPLIAKALPTGVERAGIDNT